MKVAIVQWPLSEAALTALHAQRPDRVLWLDPFRSLLPSDDDRLTCGPILSGIPTLVGSTLPGLNLPEVKPLPKVMLSSDISKIALDQQEWWIDAIGFVPVVVNPALADYVTGPAPKLRRQPAVFFCERAFSWCGCTRFGPGEPEWYLYDSDRLVDPPVRGPELPSPEADEAFRQPLELPQAEDVLKTAMLTNGCPLHLADAAVRLVAESNLDPIKEVCGCLPT